MNRLNGESAVPEPPESAGIGASRRDSSAFRAELGNLPRNLGSATWEGGAA